MQNIKKYLLIVILTAILIVPIFFGIFVKYLLFSDFSITIITVMMIWFLALLMTGKLIEIYLYDLESIDLMKQHEVVNALINKNNKLVLFVFFPLTMVMEELIFRYYLVGFFIDVMVLDGFSGIIRASLIFALYHIHFWFRFKNARITIIYIVFSFLLGLYLGFVLITLGIFFSMILHYSLSFIFYYQFSKKYK